jgi:hypothetical protein
MKTAARRLALLAGVLAVLAALGVLVLGRWPVPPDGPPPGVVSNMPGDGGLRRPFPKMAVRPAPSRLTKTTQGSPRP